MMSQDIGWHIHHSFYGHSAERIININSNSYFGDVIGFVTTTIFQYDGSYFHVYTCEADRGIKS